jgi:hypothetical protein
LPFRGLHLRLDYLRHHHDERRQHRRRRTGPRTAADLVPCFFRRKLDTHQLGFAIGERSRICTTSKPRTVASRDAAGYRFRA